LSRFVRASLDKVAKVGTTGRSDQFGQGARLVFEIEEVGRGSGASVDGFEFGPNSFRCPDGGSDERLVDAWEERNGFEGSMLIQY